MNNALFKFQKPCNEPVKGYAPGSEEKAELKKALHRLAFFAVDFLEEHTGRYRSLSAAARYARAIPAKW